MEFETRKFHGLTCVIETKKWDIRQGPGWMNISPADYGYILGHEGADGDEMDCYLGPNLKSKTVYVIDQNRIGSMLFDEHKCMLGYNTKQLALQDYFNGHTKGRAIFRGITTLTYDEFVEWLKHGDYKKSLSKNLVPQFYKELYA